MADNRQFTDHNEVGGVNVYLEDKKLAESPSQSTVASTDYFVLKDTDGVPHKIVKADVLEMVRDAMGTILANNNKGTSVAKVPTIGSTGNDLGSSSVADLASVLGVNNIYNHVFDGIMNKYTPAIEIPFESFTHGFVLARTTGSWNFRFGIVTGDKIQDVGQISPASIGDVSFENIATDDKLLVYRESNRGNLVIRSTYTSTNGTYIWLFGVNVFG